MSDQQLFKQCPNCQQFSPVERNFCTRCGHGFAQKDKESEGIGGLEGISYKPPGTSEERAPKKKKRWVDVTILGLLIVLSVMGLILYSASGESTTSGPSAEKRVPTFTSTPAESTISETTGQSDTQIHEQPTDTPVPPTPVPPAATPTPEPMVTINSNMNVRKGPGTNYPIIGTASPNQQFHITRKNPAGDWWQINFDGRIGWVYAPLVTASYSESVKVVERIPPTPRPPTPTRTPRPAPPTATVPVPLSQVERAAIWISMVNSDYGHLEVFAQVSFKVDTYGLDALVHGEEYCNPRALYSGESPTKLSCGILKYSHSSISDVRVRVNEDLWSEGDRYRCERNKASSQSRSVFACEKVRQ